VPLDSLERKGSRSKSTTRDPHRARDNRRPASELVAVQTWRLGYLGTSPRLTKRLGRRTWSRYVPTLAIASRSLVLPYSKNLANRALDDPGDHLPYPLPIFYSFSLSSRRPHRKPGASLADRIMVIHTRSPFSWSISTLGKMFIKKVDCRLCGTHHILIEIWKRPRVAAAVMKSVLLLRWRPP
jgi:hypothetical protein